MTPLPAKSHTPARTDLRQRTWAHHDWLRPIILPTPSIPGAGVRVSPQVHGHMEEGEIPKEYRVSGWQKEGGSGMWIFGRKPAVPAILIHDPYRQSGDLIL